MGGANQLASSELIGSVNDRSALRRPRGVEDLSAQDGILRTDAKARPRTLHLSTESVRLRGYRPDGVVRPA